MIYRSFIHCLITLRLEEFAEDIKSNFKVTDDVQDKQITLPGGFKLMPAKFEPITPENEVAVNGKKTKTLWLPVAPVLATHKRNPAMEADDLELWFDISDFPIDPRVVRAMGVAFFAGSYTPDEYDQYMTQGKIPSETIFSNKNLRFSGFADEMKLTGDEITVNFRDMTGILIDTKIPPDQYAKIKWGDDKTPTYIEDVIVSIIRTLPAFDKVPVELRGFPKGKYKFDTNIRQKVPTRRKKKDESGNNEPKANDPKKKNTRAAKVKEERYWDLLTDVAVQNGFVIYCDTRTDDEDVGAISRIVLAQPDTLFNEYTADSGRAVGDYVTMTNAETGKTRNEATGRFTSQDIDVRGQTYSPEGMMFVHGDGADIDYTRKFDEGEIQSIELVCQDKNKTIRSRFPKEGDIPTKVYGSWAQNKVRTYAVSGIADQEALDIAAEQTFYAFNKGQMEVHVNTSDFTSYAGKEGEADVLNLKAGSPIELWTGLGTDEQIFDPRSDFARMSKADMEEYLKGRGFDAETAGAMAEGLINPQGQNLLTKVWFTRNVTFTYDTDSVTVEIDAVNYVTPRISKLK